MAAGTPDYKWPIREYVDYQIRQLKKAGVAVHTGVEVTPELLQNKGYDAIFAAVGSEPVRPPVKGADRKEVWLAENVFGTYLHGLFDSGELVNRMAGWLAEKKGIRIPEQKAENRAAYRNRQYDLLADTVRHSLDMETIEQAMEAFENDRNTGTD